MAASGRRRVGPGLTGRSASVFNNCKVNNERAVNKQLWFNKLFILTILAVFAQGWSRLEASSLRAATRNPPVVHRSGQQRALASRPKKAEAHPSRCPSLFMEREATGKRREEVERKIENEWIGTEMKKIHFPQADQIQPCTAARHLQTNRKQSLCISLVKITYLFESHRMTDWEQSGQGQGDIRDI